MTADKDKIERVVRTVAEARGMGITVLPPDVNESQVSFTVVYAGAEEAVRAGTSAAKLSFYLNKSWSHTVQNGQDGLPIPLDRLSRPARLHLYDAAELRLFGHADAPAARGRRVCAQSESG